MIKEFGNIGDRPVKVGILTDMTNNVLMNQSGGDSVRTAILINPRQVLEFYTNSNTDKVEAHITPIDKYIYEEFIAYRHDTKHLYNILDNHEVIVDDLRGLDVIESSDYSLTALFKTSYMVKYIPSFYKYSII